MHQQPHPRPGEPTAYRRADPGARTGDDGDHLVRFFHALVYRSLRLHGSLQAEPTGTKAKMANTVLALVGENANGILECQSQRFLDLIESLGFQGRMLNVLEPDFATRLHDVLTGEVLFAWSYAGVGAKLSLGGRSLWEIADVPFISVLADAPYIMPSNHHASSPYVVNGYIYREWLELQEAHIGAPCLSTVLPMGVLPNPDSRKLPWSQRPRRMLFVKTGSDPAALRARWDEWPARLRPILHECADALAARSPGPIAPVLDACLAAHSLVLDGWKPMLFGLLHELDTYIRALRATTMARALLPLPVDIIGDGWDHLRAEDGRARFHAPISALELDAEYAQTQMLVNVTPNFASGAHERVLRGFAARCCCGLRQQRIRAHPAAALAGLLRCRMAAARPRGSGRGRVP